jgi:hypothetical protein
MSNPMVGRISSLGDKGFRYKPIRGLYFGSEYLGRKVRDVESFDWSCVPVEEVVGGTSYPAPEH